MQEEMIRLAFPFGRDNWIDFHALILYIILLYSVLTVNAETKLNCYEQMMSEFLNYFKLILVAKVTRYLYCRNGNTMDQLFKSDIFIILLYPGVMVFFLCLMTLADKQVSRVTVFFWGLGLICFAGYIAYQLMILKTAAESLLLTPDVNRRITKETFLEFERWSSYVLWLIPFVTAALGTNLMSDAITKPLEYKKPFSMFRLASDLMQASWLGVQIFFVMAIFPILILLGVLSGIKRLKNCPRRWRVYAKIYRRNYVQKYSKPRPPWAR